jgi:hypothetical protein
MKQLKSSLCWLAAAVLVVVGVQIYRHQPPKPAADPYPECPAVRAWLEKIGVVYRRPGERHFHYAEVEAAKVTVYESNER